MTELDNFLNMLDRIEAVYSREDEKNGTILIEVQNSGDGGGYAGFISDWLFTAHGKLISVAHWE